MARYDLSEKIGGPRAQRQEPQTRPLTIRATVVRAPASTADELVLLPMGRLGGEGHGFTVPAGHWDSRSDGTLPKEGNVCELVFDHLGDAWVPMWSPY